jgi:aspartyl-tRNA(Asn)/glutamyl-tRNA(Gln) amidotransferase subunit C
MSVESFSSEALDANAVRHVAKLARLRLGDDEVERFRSQLGAILEHISMLRKVDVSDVEPMAHPLPMTNRLDDDVPVDPMPIEDVLRNAPAVEGRFLAVPKVLGEGGGA